MSTKEENTLILIVSSILVLTIIVVLIPKKLWVPVILISPVPPIP